MPDYSVTLDSSDMIIFSSRGDIPVSSNPPLAVQVGSLIPEIYHDARLIAPDWDVYYLEREWRKFTALLRRIEDHYEPTQKQDRLHSLS